MVLKRLELKNYKNLTEVFEFADCTNVLIYPNGWGKTNLLEAIDYLSSLKSFRGLRDADLLDWDADDTFVSLKTKLSNRKSVELEVIISSRQETQNRIAKAKTKTNTKVKTRKTVKINGANTTPKKFKTQLSTFFYSPHNADIVSSTPDIRRNQFDRFISEFDENYDKLLKEYKFVLRSRNKLLSRINEGREDEIQLDYWDSRFVELGERILTKRLGLLDDLDQFIKQASDELYKSGLDLEVVYSSKVVDKDIMILGDKIGNNRMKEIAAGMTLYGPHRDDYDFLLKNNLLRDTGSRGQQRIAGIVLLYALNGLFYEQFSARPILLFDDVFSELDDKHRVNIEKSLQKLENQVFVTSSQRELFTDGFLQEAFNVVSL
ncbi:DNA replication and repair protein RecF [Candidatus Dojkabacteria bacterium]|nr:DNA replication and repair protein RecF [Candidatus Dojkabacteria bacterium]